MNSEQPINVYQFIQQPKRLKTSAIKQNARTHLNTMKNNSHPCIGKLLLICWVSGLTFTGYVSVAGTVRLSVGDSVGVFISTYRTMPSQIPWFKVLFWQKGRRAESIRSVTQAGALWLWIHLLWFRITGIGNLFNISSRRQSAFNP